MTSGGRSHGGCSRPATHVGDQEGGGSADRPGARSLVAGDQHFKEADIEKVAYEISMMEKVGVEVQDEVLDGCTSSPSPTRTRRGGMDYAKDVLGRSMGPQKAADVINRLMQAREPGPSISSARTDPTQLISFIQHEHPQTIALILAHVDPQQAAGIISVSPGTSRPRWPCASPP